MLSLVMIQALSLKKSALTYIDFHLWYLQMSKFIIEDLVKAAES